MPQRAVSLHTRVTAAAAELTELIPRLENEIPHKQRHGFTAGGSPSKGGHRPLAAWNSAAAMTVMTIHQGLRDMEADLQYLINGRTRKRGGADTVTSKLLSQIPALTAGTDEHAARKVAQQLEQWAWQARVVLGEAEPAQQLPRLPGQPVAACPYCQSRTLRYLPSSGKVRCLNPVCRDTEGNKPAGRLGVGAYSGEPALLWRDGTVGAQA